MTRSTNVVPCKLTELIQAVPRPSNGKGWYSVEEIAKRCGMSPSWARTQVRLSIEAGQWEVGSRVIVSVLNGKRFNVPVYRPVAK